MEQLAIFEEKIELSPFDLHGEITDFNEILLKKLRKRLEGRCSQHGYVIPGSIELLSRSLGMMEKGRFTADFLYYCKAQGRVFNPSDGTLLTMKVDIKNNAGIYGVVEGAIEVIVARDIHIGDEEFHMIGLGDTIQVKVLKSRFQVNDEKITSICEFVQKVEAVPPSGLTGAAGAGASTKGPGVVVLGETEEEEESGESKNAEGEEEGESKEGDEDEEEGEGEGEEEGESEGEEEPKVGMAALNANNEGEGSLSENEES